MKTKKTLFVLFFLILCIFIKTDYRLEPGIYCCKDDHDYYAHAETIAIDFDFDYSNQFYGNEEERFIYNGKTAPSAFFGAGLLSAPFLFLGNIFDIIFEGRGMFNFKIIFYSFSSIFYLIFTFILINKISISLNPRFSSLFLYIFVLGSGVGYYSFERYSMSHIYEIFSITLLIYFCISFFVIKDNNKIAFMIPLLIMIAMMTRWVNIYVIFLPFIVAKMLSKPLNKLLKNRYFLSSFIFSFLLFLYHTYLIFGVVTLNVEFTYNTSGTLSNFIGSDFGLMPFIFKNIKNLFLLLFGPEFGLFWFAPIIFFGIYLSVKNLILNSTKQKVVYLFVILCFMQVFALVLIWQSAGSSYGYRYTFNLVPLSLLILFCQTKLHKLELFYIKFMSVFASLSVLYFETSKNTQLATEYTTNMFGKITKFTNPEYLYGFIKSFYELEVYLKIFAQSFLGFAIFYLIIYIFGIDNFYTFMNNLSLPSENSDFQNLINKIQIIEFEKFVVSIILILLATFLLTKHTYDSKQYIQNDLN